LLIQIFEDVHAQFVFLNELVGTRGGLGGLMFIV
jgi:hypothetical protein